MTTKNNGYKDCDNRKKFIPNIDFLKNKYNIAYLVITIISTKSKGYKLFLNADIAVLNIFVFFPILLFQYFK